VSEESSDGEGGDVYVTLLSDTQYPNGHAGTGSVLSTDGWDLIWERKVVWWNNVCCALFTHAQLLKLKQEVEFVFIITDKARTKGGGRQVSVL